MHNLMDSTFNGLPGSEMYRAQLFPELFPHEKEMMLENWSQDDLEMYVGGVFTPGYGMRQISGGSTADAYIQRYELTERKK